MEKYGMTMEAIADHSVPEKWLEQRQERQAQIERKLSEMTIDTIATFQAEKYKIGKYVIGTSLKGMQKHRPKTFREAKEGMEVGYKIATEAIGLDKPNNQVNIQNNTYLSLTDFLTQMQKRKQEKLAYEEQTNI